MEKEAFSEAVEDYLKTIYELTLGAGTTSTTEVAGRMDVTPASATAMLQRLSGLEPPLLAYHKYQGVELTPEGRRVALQVIRQHRLLELFLVNTMGYAWDEVHEDAERLEHAVSPRFMRHLEAIVGDARLDPHGDPIPDADLNVPVFDTMPLGELPIGKRGIVRRIVTRDSSLLHYLGEMGLQPGAVVEVIECVPYDRTMRINIERGHNQTERVLGPDITRIILVEVETG